MLRYGRDDLLSLRPLAPPTVDRSVRKALFSFGLWLPGRYRRHRRSAYNTPPTGLIAGQGPPDHKTSGTSANNNNKYVGRVIQAACLNVRSVNNKIAIISDLIKENKLQLIGLTETWHESQDDVALRRITLPGYRCIDVARKPNKDGRCYGGIAVVYEDTSLPNSFRSASSQPRSKSSVRDSHPKVQLSLSLSSIARVAPL